MLDFYDHYDQTDGKGGKPETVREKIAFGIQQHSTFGPDVLEDYLNDLVETVQRERDGEWYQLGMILNE